MKKTLKIHTIDILIGFFIGIIMLIIYSYIKSLSLPFAEEGLLTMPTIFPGFILSILMAPLIVFIEKMDLPLDPSYILYFNLLGWTLLVVFIGNSIRKIKNK